MNIHLTYSISRDRRSLYVRADVKARAKLLELKAEDDEQGCGPFGTEVMLYDVFEHLICNSELGWISPDVCGDLTDAPILGILGEMIGVEDWTEGDGNVFAGSMMGKPLVQPVLERWAYMSYQVRNPLDDLIEKGEAEFVAP